MNKALIAVALVIGLAGCAEMAEKGERASLTRQGFPVAYQDGYIHGCASGKNAYDSLSYPTKSMNRYGVDRLYTAGWDDAYEKCKAQVKMYIDAMGSRR